MPRTQAIIRSVLLDTVDFAGRTVMEDMSGNATEKVTVPQWANSIKSAKLLYTGDGAALGSSVGFILIEDCPDGPHDLVCGGLGAELVNGKHDGVAPCVIDELNIAVVPGSEITISGQMSGEDSGCVVNSIECIFSSEPAIPRMKYTGMEHQITAIDTNAQLADLRGTTDTLKVPGNCRKIGMVGIATGCDLGALGCGGHSLILMSGAGVFDDQEILGSGYGGELITSAGDTTPAVYEKRDIRTNPGERIMVEDRQTGEDCGTLSMGLSVGWVLGGGQGSRRGPVFGRRG